MNIMDFLEQSGKKVKKSKTIKEKQVIPNKDQNKEISFNDLIVDIDKKRDSIIKDQESRKPKIKEYSDRIEYTFEGKTFTFCKEGYKLFEEDFCDEDSYKIIVDNNYLARENKINEGKNYFHRWLMKDEVEDLKNKNKCSYEDIQVHHKDSTTTNNKKDNLQPLTKKEHRKLHIKNKFKGSDSEFEDWSSRLD